MKVFLACNFPRDDKLGSARTPVRLEPELVALGVTVRSLYSDELLAAGFGRAASLTAPLRMAWAARAHAADADIADIAGGDGYLYFPYARVRRPRQALVARSNGLWDLAIRDTEPRARGSTRAVLSGLYQANTLCRFEQGAIRSADAAVFLSQCDADEVVRRGWRTRETALSVNPGVDADFAVPAPLGARRDVAVVGTFYFRKGSDVVARVMSRVLAEQPGLGLTLFAPGRTREHVLGAFDERVRGSVSIVDALPASELARRLGEFSLFLFPTRYEGFGIVVLEAMRAGLAVVTTPTGAGADIVRDGENGLLVPPGDVEATYRAVTRLLADDPLRQRLAAGAAAAAEGRTWRRAAEQLVRVYERALRQRDLRCGAVGPQFQ